MLGLEDSLPVLKEMGASAVFVDENHHVTVAGELDFELTADGYTVSQEAL